MTQKQAQGMPINTIILAILGLVILVILLYMTGYRLQIFGGTLASCDAQGGNCVDEQTCNKVESAITIKGTSCPKDKLCCKALIPQPADAFCAGPNDCASKKCPSGTCIA